MKNQDYFLFKKMAKNQDDLYKKIENLVNDTQGLSIVGETLTMKSLLKANLPSTLRI